jgi:hypothetical protein
MMPTSISLLSVLRPKASVTARRLGEEMVLLDLETGCYFGLNPVGTEVWERAQGGAALGDIVAGIVEAYDVAIKTSSSAWPLPAPSGARTAAGCGRAARWCWPTSVCARPPSLVRSASLSPCPVAISP